MGDGSQTDNLVFGALLALFEKNYLTLAMSNKEGLPIRHWQLIIENWKTIQGINNWRCCAVVSFAALKKPCWTEFWWMRSKRGTNLYSLGSIQILYHKKLRSGTICSNATKRSGLVDSLHEVVSVQTFQYHVKKKATENIIKICSDSIVISKKKYLGCFS